MQNKEQTKNTDTQLRFPSQMSSQSTSSKNKNWVSLQISKTKKQGIEIVNQEKKKKKQ